jgi:hypothetical protein
MPGAASDSQRVKTMGGDGRPNAIVLTRVHLDYVGPLETLAGEGRTGLRHSLHPYLNGISAAGPNCR